RRPASALRGAAAGLALRRPRSSPSRDRRLPRAPALPRRARRARPAARAQGSASRRRARAARVGAPRLLARVEDLADLRVDDLGLVPERRSVTEALEQVEGA